MKILIAYATTEGQTRKICQTIAEQLDGLGHQVELLDTARKRRDVHPDDFDRFIVAASVHQDKHQGEIDVYTLGRDGRPGGEGVDADIGNWDLN